MQHRSSCDGHGLYTAVYGVRSLGNFSVFFQWRTFGRGSMAPASAETTGVVPVLLIPSTRRLAGSDPDARVC